MRSMWWTIVFCWSIDTTTARRTLLAAGSSALAGGILGAPWVARAQSAEFVYK
jgi:hypothetical protein